MMFFEVGLTSLALCCQNWVKKTNTFSPSFFGQGGVEVLGCSG